MVYPYNEILRIHKRKNVDTCYYMNEPLRHYAKWKNLTIQGHILYNCIIWNIQNKEIDRGRNKDFVTCSGTPNQFSRGNNTLSVFSGYE